MRYCYSELRLQLRVRVGYHRLSSVYKERSAELKGVCETATNALYSLWSFHNGLFEAYHFYDRFVIILAKGKRVIELRVATDDAFYRVAYVYLFL